MRKSRNVTPFATAITDNFTECFHSLKSTHFKYMHVDYFVSLFSSVYTG